MSYKNRALPEQLPQNDPAAKPLADSRKVRSEDLLDGHGELVIVHQGREYKLRLTQNGKLILTA